MVEQWTQADLMEYLKNGKTPSRDRAARAVADLEPPPGHAPVAANEVPAFTAPVRVAFHSIRTRLADADGLSGKAVLDGIVACGLLADDSAKFVRSVEHTQEKGKREETRIVIEEA